MVVITHYQRLLDYIVPDRVHVLLDGRIARSGGKELALELEKSGYAAFGAPAQARRLRAAAMTGQTILPADGYEALFAAALPHLPGAPPRAAARVARGEFRALPGARLPGAEGRGLEIHLGPAARARAVRAAGARPRSSARRWRLTCCRSGARCAWCSSTARSRRTCRTICLPLRSGAVQSLGAALDAGSAEPALAGLEERLGARLQRVERRARGRWRPDPPRRAARACRARSSCCSSASARTGRR